MAEQPLTPQDIQKAMITEWMRMKKVIAEAESLRPKMKRAERFIKQLSDIWNLPLPSELVPKDPVKVPSVQKPDGTIVVDELTCQEPNCGRGFKNAQAIAVHRSRASCEIMGPGHGKQCPNHRAMW